MNEIITAERQILYSLSLVAIVAPQSFFVLFMRAELDGSVGHDPHHGGRVPPPQAEQPILHVSAVDEPKGLLGVVHMSGQEQTDGRCSSHFPHLTI